MMESWRSIPQEQLSVRSIASQANAAASAIDYHFGSLEQLSLHTQKVALGLAAHWFEARARALQPFAQAQLTPSQRAGVCAAIIDDWAEQEGALAWAAYEAASLARRHGHRDNTHREVWRQWLTLWQGFWREVAAALGIAHAGDVLFVFHQGCGPIHLLRGNRALDRALLDEDLQVLLDPTLVHRSSTGAVRRTYRAAIDTAHFAATQPSAHLASRTPPIRVEEAAAAILCEQGLDALNYRAVARRAGCTLGQVSWIFKSRADLLTRAFISLYNSMAMDTRPATVPPAGALMETTISVLVTGQIPLLNAFHDLIGHVARNPDQAMLQAPFRVFSDPAAVWVLTGLLSIDEEEAMVLSPAFAAMCRGIDYAAHGANDPASVRALASAVFDQWIEQSRAANSAAA